jgi:hypothetical protein
MAAHIEFGGAMGGGAPVYTGLSNAATIATVASTQTPFTARAGDYARVSAIDAAVMIAVGPNPTAVASGAGMRYVPAETSIDIGPLSEGDKIAAIDAA